MWLQGEDERRLAIMSVCDSVRSCMATSMGKDCCPPIGSDELLMLVKPDSSVAHTDLLSFSAMSRRLGASVLTLHLLLVPPHLTLSFMANSLSAHAAHACGHARVHM